jgi:flagellar biogenesis protein FliO
MQSFDWGQFIASTVSVLLLLGGALWWVKRNRSFGGVASEDKRIQMIEALPLSLKHKMVLIQVDNQMILASVSPAEVKTLHAWTQGDSHVA